MAVQRSPTGVAALEVAAAMFLAVVHEHREAEPVAADLPVVCPVCCLVCPVG